MNSVGRLIIFRDFSPISIIKPLEIYINNKFITNLSMGSSCSIDLPNGIYTLFTKIDYCVSPKIEITILNNEIKYFKTGHIGSQLNPFTYIRMFSKNHSIFLKELTIHNFYSFYINSETSTNLISLLDLSSQNKISIELTLNSTDTTKKIFSAFSKVPIGTDLKTYTFSTIKKHKIHLGIFGLVLFLFINNFNLSKFWNLQHFSLTLISSAVLTVLILTTLKRSLSK